MYKCGIDTFITATRIEHDCEWCGETIPRKRNAMKRDYLFDDSWIHAWMHLDCYRAMGSLHDIEWDEQGEFHRGSTQRREK